MKILVVGGGAAGMTAALSAAQNGAQVVLFEHNEKLGKKLYITGKGRCNFTNTADKAEFFAQIVSNPKFVYSAVYGFDAEALRALLARYGLRDKEERGGRVFPQSDKSSDVIRTLSRALTENDVEIRLRSEVTEILTRQNRAIGVRTAEGDIFGDAVIVATGGLSYPATGSTGSGYRWAKACGHRIVPLRPALVPIVLREKITCEGLSLKNVRVSVWDRERILASEFGEMLFTADGVSGPVVLTLTSRVNRCPIRALTLSIDLKPALESEQLDARLLRDFQRYSNRDFANSLHDLLPASLIAEIVARSGIPSDKKVHQITADERKSLANLFKNLRYGIAGIGELDHAIVTAGGVDVSEINPATMESKLVRKLYFAGELLDVDALTGGFNLQIAFSTGYLAGRKSTEGI